MAENVIIRYGRYEVDPSRMSDYVQQQTINEAEINRLVKSRHMYLEWMHRHFADRVSPPPIEE